MKKGTKSLLFGVHQFLWHPFTVLLAWIWLYRKFPGWRELICIIIHDWGYRGKENMDDEEGEKHPELAFKIAKKIFKDEYYAYLCLYHSRHYARLYGAEPSMLCWADKLSIMFDPIWLYLPRAIMSGEINEYRKNCAKSNFVPISATNREWYVWIRIHFKKLGTQRRADVIPYCDGNKSKNKPEVKNANKL